MAAQGIGQHGALSNQQLSPAVHQQRRLLLGRLHRHEAHRWPLDGFANRLGIGRVILVALHVGLHILRRHETNLMAKRPQLARPVMRRRAGLHADQTSWHAGKECEHLAAPQPLAQDRRARRIGAMDLKDVLGQIQPNRCNLIHGWLPFLVIFDDHHFGTQMP